MDVTSVPKIPLSNFECVHCGRIYHDADLCSSDDCLVTTRYARTSEPLDSG
jgi:hypothetical protein